MEEPRRLGVLVHLRDLLLPAVVVLDLTVRHAHRHDARAARLDAVALVLAVRSLIDR